ncbi:MAG: sigma 54-interacting transcriptional regulator [Acidobacteria bacterium]|nr:sigma 54-interacting transcriptional regulator [Acidobacteriota bacterium]
MDLAPLPSIILAITEQRSLCAVLATIVGSAARQPNVALARVWLRQSDRECPHCSRGRQNSPDALHLRASAGTSQTSGADWSRTNGSFHQIPLNRADSKISHIATSGESVRIQRLSEDPWVRYPEWARSEELVGFAGHPLLFRGEVLGVLAVFRRTEPDDACWEWLRVLADAAAVAIANARAFEQVDSLRHDLEMERDYLRQEVKEAGLFGEILGRSDALTKVLRQVEMVAPTDASVLILGETGSGKELIARAIHQRSPRAHKPLVKVNCGSIPRELFESEFFGHARGSFTGAIRDRVGRFQLADGGTLFLDEVGEIPLELQSKLLRVLQEGEFERVGDETTRRVNVRVVAATNRDLRQEAEAGRFRLDLFYRLGVFPVEVPPLRERSEDIPELAAYFVRQACARFHVSEPRLIERELERARQYEWPGNVRELQNVVERAVILAQDGTLTLELPQPKRMAAAASAPAPSTDVIPEEEWRRRERANILAALQKASFRVSGEGGAAELLGVNPGTLASRLKSLGIDKRDYRA